MSDLCERCGERPPTSKGVLCVSCTSYFSAKRNLSYLASLDRSRSHGIIAKNKSAPFRRSEGRADLRNEPTLPTVNWLNRKEI